MTEPALIDTMQQNVKQALAEDVGSGDLTHTLIPESAQASAKVICREPTVLCGRAWFESVFEQLHYQGQIKWRHQEGEWVEANQILCEIRGNARTLLTGERTALNFLQTLCATATQARRYADTVKGTNTKILDTRKTLPGLRLAQKYAVVCGGCHNHRLGLYDGILIKENHIRAAGSIAKAFEAAKSVATSNTLLEIEVENLEELGQAIAAGAKRLLLDNFSLSDLKAAVAQAQGKARLEASGSITLNNVKAIADTGVDFISIGSITKNIKAIDLSMQFDAT